MSKKERKTEKRKLILDSLGVKVAEKATLPKEPKVATKKQPKAKVQNQEQVDTVDDVNIDVKVNGDIATFVGEVDNPERLKSALQDASDSAKSKKSNQNDVDIKRLLEIQKERLDRLFANAKDLDPIEEQPKQADIEIKNPMPEFIDEGEQISELVTKYSNEDGDIMIINQSNKAPKGEPITEYGSLPPIRPGDKDYDKYVRNPNFLRREDRER